MTKKLDLTGQKFNRLTAVSPGPNTVHGTTRWNCVCDCGTERLVKTTDLRDGTTASCGCLRLERLRAKVQKHGKTKTKEYLAWQNMKARCYSKSDINYANYGGRGIKVCDEWRDSFQAFYDHLGPAPGDTSDTQIDRIDNSGNYEPGNLRWVTRAESYANKRDNIVVEYHGREMLLNEYLKETGDHYYGAIRKIRAGTLRLSRVGDGTSVGRRLGKCIEGLPIGERKFSVLDKSTFRR